jgi:protoheme ferro-lyase
MKKILGVRCTIIVVRIIECAKFIECLWKINMEIKRCNNEKNINNYKIICSFNKYFDVFNLVKNAIRRNENERK